MTNAEWPKSVACVALAYPLTAPTIVAMVERTRNPWSQQVRALLFPDAQLLSVTAHETNSAPSRCGQCHHDMPPPRGIARIAEGPFWSEADANASFTV